MSKTAHRAAGRLLAAGQPLREDYQYELHGVQALFLFLDPLRGWRRARSMRARTTIRPGQEPPGA